VGAWHGSPAQPAAPVAASAGGQLPQHHHQQPQPQQPQPQLLPLSAEERKRAQHLINASAPPATLKPDNPEWRDKKWFDVGPVNL
jgi:hypothetical protein